MGLQLPYIIKAVVSHEPTLWPTLLYRCLDVVAIFLVLLVLRFVWVQSIWRLSGLLRRLRGKGELTLVPTARSCWLLTVGGVRGAVTLAGVMSVPLLLAPGQDFPERDLLIFIAAGVILLSLIAACIALPLLLRGVEKSPDEKRHNEVREAWKKTAVSAIHALETEEPAEAEDQQDADQADVDAVLAQFSREGRFVAAAARLVADGLGEQRGLDVRVIAAAGGRVLGSRVEVGVGGHLARDLGGEANVRGRFGPR